MVSSHPTNRSSCNCSRTRKIQFFSCLRLTMSFSVSFYETNVIQQPLASLFYTFKYSPFFYFRKRITVCKLLSLQQLSVRFRKQVILVIKYFCLLTFHQFFSLKHYYYLSLAFNFSSASLIFLIRLQILVSDFSLCPPQDQPSILYVENNWFSFDFIGNNIRMEIRNK